MRAVFCILAAMYLFRVAGQIKPHTARHLIISGLIYLLSFAVCFTAVVFCVYGM